MIVPYDAPGRYHVPSSEHGADPYLVDVCAFQGNGECSCPHFNFRLREHMERHKTNGTKPNAPLHCKHIAEARDFLASEVIAKLIQQEGRADG